MSPPCKILVCFGTRPEAIKLAPVALELAASPDFELGLCATGQHREMVESTLELFGLRPDHDLRLMTQDQSLEALTASTLTGVAAVLEASQPDWVIVQGDTTTALASALAGFYAGVPVAHVEAGLRTPSAGIPFPEEMNRRLVSRLARLHFAPTDRARQALETEAIPEERIFVVGNTVVDALRHVVARSRENDATHLARFGLDPVRKLLLVTGHRRESFGAGVEALCDAIIEIAAAHPDDLEIVYPVHLNPHVTGPVHDRLGNVANVRLLPPLDYEAFLWLLDRCLLVLTDSGGVQEEAPTLGKPVLVTRDYTERPEAVEAGAARLVGTDRHTIVRGVERILGDPSTYRSMALEREIFGDGHASKRIVDVLRRARGSFRVS